MCNSTKSYGQHNTAIISMQRHALQDYQMQLLLLERQNQRRLLLARMEQNSIGQRSVISITGRPIESVWNPPLSPRYFDLIQCFTIEIDFPPAPVPHKAATVQFSPMMESLSDGHNLIQVNHERRLYDYCDYLHRLVERLRQIQTRIAQVKIVIKCESTYDELEDVCFAVKLLLKPFQRLCNVNSIELASLTRRDFGDKGDETELLISDSTSDEAQKSFVEYINCWSRDLSTFQPSAESAQLFDAYGRLEKVIYDIKDRFQPTDPNFHRVEDLLHAARVTREADNLEWFREIWKQVVNIVRMISILLLSSRSNFGPLFLFFLIKGMGPTTPETCFDTMLALINNLQ